MTSIAHQVRQVFLIPADMAGVKEELAALVASAPEDLQTIALAFAESLRGVNRTLAIPFDYTFSEVQSLHWQRIHSAERIRALPTGSGPPDEALALENARTKFAQFMAEEGHTLLPNAVLERLIRLTEDADSLLAARELARQGVVLVWSAVEVLVRDAFVYLLNRNPEHADKLLQDTSSRKRFSAERVDWQTLADYGYDMSRSVGTYLISKADLKNVPAIRSTLQALFPGASDLHAILSDRRLWDLSQRRHLIVHRRGIVDQEYREATGHDLSLGESLWVTPAEVEDAIDASLSLGKALIREVKNAG